MSTHLRGIKSLAVISIKACHCVRPPNTRRKETTLPIISVSRLSIGLIDFVTIGKGIIAGTAIAAIFAAAVTEELIISVAADQNIVGIIAIESIVPVQPDQAIFAVAAMNNVIAAGPKD